MAEEVSNQGGQSQGQSTTTPAQNQAPGFQIPEKFAGKSAEEIAKSYVELEKQYGSHAEKLKGLEAYSKFGTPEQINEALNWARDAYAKIQKGDLIERAKVKAAEASTSPSTAPWDADDWAYKSPAEQFKAFSDYQQSQAKSYIDQVASQYGQQIGSLAQRDAREKAILLRAVKAAVQNPGVDPEEILAEASGLASKSAEELIDMYLESRQNSPEALSKRIADETAKAVAAARQEWEAKQQEELYKPAGPPKARLIKSQSREDEFKLIQQNLAKQGIRF